MVMFQDGRYFDFKALSIVLENDIGDSQSQTN